MGLNYLLNSRQHIYSNGYFGRKETKKYFYLMTYSAHFVYSYLSSDTWFAMRETNQKHSTINTKTKQNKVKTTHKIYEVFVFLCQQKT